MKRGVTWAALLVLVGVVPVIAQQDESAGACILCHSSEDWFDEEGISIVSDHAGSVHAQLGISCADCHGGNDAVELLDDMEAAMDPQYGPNPYRGVPAPAEIPGFCGRCHSDLDYMRRFAPDARTDQEAEYWTSAHGRALEAGDTNVATCTGCHGRHDILRVDDTAAPVFAKNVHETCGSCHSSREHMAGYELADGRPLPTDQRARWERSVHARALLEREDLFAPTCNDCHGNHGARPPGIESITYVCGQCHGREASLFRGSAKHGLWEEHDEYLDGVGFESCDACHEAPDPQAEITDLYHFGECTACHGSHGIVRPTLAFFAPFDRTPCAFCHEAATEGAADAVEISGREAVYLERRDELIAEAREQGIVGEDRFNWLVDRALTLEEHGEGEESSHPGQEGARERFERLYEKFRIGKTYYEYVPDGGGEPVRVDLQRCTWCHAEQPTLTDESKGHRVGLEIADQVTGLMALTTRAEAGLRAARRGGIELKQAMLDIDRAVDAQIDVQVLVHRFRTDGEFAEALEEGRAHALAALEAGEEAHAELRFRRQGLLAFVAFVVLTLIGLGLKIRQL